ncbi:MAG: hypothetical protein ACM3JG_05645 [Thiohalocapsa sp.]
MGNLLCMGLFLRLCAIPSPRRGHRADHRLSARMDVNMLDSDDLLPFAAVAIERVEKDGKAPRQFVGLAQVLAPTLVSLLPDHRPAIALHCRAMRRDQLGGHHSFQLVFWRDPD